MKDADAVIAALDLRPLGFEGGYFRETLRSGVTLSRDLPEGFTGPRNLHTAIYYLLAPDSQSLMHRLKADEVYHFYSGDPVDLLLLFPDGAHDTVTLGTDLTAGQVPQLRVPSGVWQGGTLRDGGRYGLMGTTMAPGFEQADFELGRYADLARQYPEVASRLRPLTPTQVETPRLELRAATRDLIYAEQHDLRSFSTGLGAEVPSDWPPRGHGARTLDTAFAALKRGRDQRDWWTWYFIERGPSPRRLIGVGGFKGPPQAGEVEIGFGVIPSREGEGLASEAVRGLVEHARSQPDVRRVVAETHTDHPASSQVLYKSGFRPVAPEGGRRARRYALDL